MQFYKRYFHLVKSTPNYRLTGEFGLLPLEYYFYKAAIHFRTKLVEAKPSKCLIGKMYEEIFNHLEQKDYRYSWCGRIEKLFRNLVLDHLWKEQASINSKLYQIIVNERLMQYF